jgi:hypothetical protein
MVAAMLAALATALPAQRDGTAPGQPRGALVDAVIATVNDSAIMLSTIQTAARSLIEGEVARLGIALPPARIQEIRQERLEDELRRHRMAQAAKTFGPLTPDQIEQLLDDSFERDRQQQVRDLGSYNEYSQLLKRSGRTWPTHVREQRVEKLDQFAQELSVGRRLARQTNLFVTPRMLREAYAEMVEFFVHPAEARIVQIAFVGADAKQHAEQAAAMWRAEPQLDVRELATRLPEARSTVIAAVLASSLAEQLAGVRTFALAGPENAVSAPIAIGDPEQPAWHVVRIVQYQPAADGRFEDPAVQRKLREFCAQRVVNEFRKQAYEQAKQRTEVRIVFDSLR